MNVISQYKSYLYALYHLAIIFIFFLRITYNQNKRIRRKISSSPNIEQIKTRVHVNFSNGGKMKFHMLLVTYSEYMYPGGGKKKRPTKISFAYYNHLTIQRII